MDINKGKFIHFICQLGEVARLKVGKAYNSSFEWTLDNSPWEGQGATNTSSHRIKIVDRHVNITCPQIYRQSPWVWFAAATPGYRVISIHGGPPIFHTHAGKLHLRTLSIPSETTPATASCVYIGRVAHRPGVVRQRSVAFCYVAWPLHALQASVCSAHSVHARRGRRKRAALSADSVARSRSLESSSAGARPAGRPATRPSRACASVRPCVPVDGSPRRRGLGAACLPGPDSDSGRA